jgi:hypothetical protein
LPAQGEALEAFGLDDGVDPAAIESNVISGG